METFKKPRCELEQEKIEKLIELEQQPMVIGIEGGPCGGKTTFVESLEAFETDKPIIILPEAATRVAGEYQKNGIDVMKRMKTDEQLFIRFETDVQDLTDYQIERARNKYFGTGAVIVSDRVDIGGYIDMAKYLQILERAGRSQPGMFDNVDQILYFPTVARKDPAAYMRLRESNPIRKETAQEAVAVCDRLMASVSRHPEFHYLDAGDFKSTLSAARGYIFNRDHKYKRSGCLIGDYGQVDRLIARKVNGGLMLGTSEVYQEFTELEGGWKYKLKCELLDSSHSFCRRSVQFRDPYRGQEIDRTISRQDYLQLKGEDSKDEVAKIRHKFLHTDEASGVTDIWILEHLHVKGADFGWVFEVQRSSDESLAELKPPFEVFVDNDRPKLEVARAALMFA